MIINLVIPAFDCYRGTIMYMAPEILVKSLRLKSASFQDLKRVDMRAFGMVLFILVNPDLKYPYELDIDPNESTIDQIQELLTSCKRPKESSKYIEIQTMKWVLIQKAFEDCTNFDASRRPTAENMRCTSSNVHETVSDQTSNNKIATDHLGDVKLALNQQQKTVDDKKQNKVEVIDQNIKQLPSVVSARYKLYDVIKCIVCMATADVNKYISSQTSQNI